MNRRTLLATLAALPLCGWMKPKTNQTRIVGFTFTTAEGIDKRLVRNSAGDWVAVEVQRGIFTVNEVRRYFGQEKA